jgi:hypothetical protein
MNIHCVETHLGEDRSLKLTDIPFRPGSTVQVILVEGAVAPAKTEERFPFRGLPYTYEDPFGPAVPPEEWEALR